MPLPTFKAFFLLFPKDSRAASKLSQDLLARAAAKNLEVSPSGGIPNHGPGHQTKASHSDQSHDNLSVLSAGVPVVLEAVMDAMVVWCGICWRGGEIAKER